MTHIERIWYSDPLGLFAGDRIARFLPERDAPLVQQLNSIMRFAIYFAVIMFLVGRRRIGMITVGLVAAGTAALAMAAQADTFGGEDLHVDVDGRASSDANPVRKTTRTMTTCSAPTLDNPFGNVMLSDYTVSPDRPPACDLQDPEVAEKVEDLFGHNLYTDVSDALHRTANSRQFYSNPSTTIPNDQGAFARWCYQTGPGCKEGNGDRCDTNTFRSIPGR